MSREITLYFPEKFGPHWPSLWKGRHVSGFSVPHYFHPLSAFTANILPWVFHGLIRVLDYFVLGSTGDKEVSTTQKDVGDLFQIKTSLRVWGEKKNDVSLSLCFCSSHQPRWYIVLETRDHFLLIGLCFVSYLHFWDSPSSCRVVLFRWLSLLHLQLRTLEVFF